MQSHEQVSVPSTGFKSRYSVTATASAAREKKNCLADSPKNMVSV